jgi:trans-aconitate 2-methyltransferase
MPGAHRWSAEQYLKFEGERNRPLDDLLGRIPPLNPQHAADLGCGPGTSTQRLQARFPQAAVVGLDRSAEMLDAARQRMPHHEFRLVDLGVWQEPERYDLLLANAVLQWLPDHDALLPRLLRQLRPGGVLAVQMPDNLDEASHRLMREVAEQPRWAGRLAAAAARPRMHSPQHYYARLLEATPLIDLWRTTYYLPLPGGIADIVEWFKGSALQPYLQALTADEAQRYLADYAQALSAAYPCLPDGSVLLPFPRVFLVAQKPAG